MNYLPQLYISIQTRLFPMIEEEIGEITVKMKEFLQIVELSRPARFLTDAMRWCGLGRPMASREKMLRAFFLKSVHDLPTTKLLIENLRTNPTWRQLCGWEYANEVPSEATFSRAFKEFAEARLGERIHETIVTEQCVDRLVGHSSKDSTAIHGREKACRKNTSKTEAKKKRGRKSAAEKALLAEQEAAEVKTRRLELQPGRTLADNLADLPQGCDWGGKKNSKGKTEYWRGYKLHLDFGDGGIPLAAILTSASVHDSQAAIPLMQMSAARGATVLYDLADSAYDADEIKAFSRSLGHVPIIDPNPRRGDALELAPAEKIRYRERTTAERGNSELKDNYGANHVRVKGHLKVFCHLMFGVIAVITKQLFNLLE